MIRAPDVRERLIALVAEDERVRSELAADGSLFEGYNARMREVHEHNAGGLAEIIAVHGWPGFALAGTDGAAAAWRIAQHAIGLPEFQRRCFRLLEEAVAREDAEPKHVAMLDDRIAFNERRPQKYGTQFDWDENGKMSPWLLDDPVAVDRRRAALGMKSMAEQEAALSADSRDWMEHPPKDWHARQREIEGWAREVGWIPGRRGDS